MNQNLIIVVIGVLILVGAGVLFFVKKPEPVTQNEPQQPQQQSTSTPTPQNTATSTSNDPEPGPGEDTFAALVSFTDDGYSPASVSIKKGQTVRFVNNSSTETWPASAAHPTHTVYPQKSADDCLGSAFDACRSLKAGEFWEFTFNSTGSWGYHDHVHANRRGTVVVTE